MRAALLLVVLALPLVAGGDAYVVLLDWQEGRALAGTTVLAMSPVADRFAFDVDACHRQLLLDLLYGPAEVGADVEGVGSVALAYEFLVETWRGDERLSQVRVREPGYGYALGVADASGAHEVRVSLANGADVEWQLRVRGHAVADELACEARVVVNEVEANPAGADAGAEWVELHNADALETVDLSLWTLRSTHGDTRALTLPDGLLLAPGARVRIDFPTQFLDNAEESVVLVDAFGRTRDVTPTASDLEDDQRTWQREVDGGETWVFANATPP